MERKCYFRWPSIYGLVCLINNNTLQSFVLSRMNEIFMFPFWNLNLNKYDWKIFCLQKQHIVTN